MMEIQHQHEHLHQFLWTLPPFESVISMASLLDLKASSISIGHVIFDGLLLTWCCLFKLGVFFCFATVIFILQIRDIAEATQDIAVLRFAKKT